MKPSGASSPSPAGVNVLAPAKINLFLHVGEQRSDGYHALESLVVFAETGDRLFVTPAEDLSLDITGPFARHLAKQDNSVMKAAQALRAMGVGEDAGARIVLEKTLPLASGLGGGSADAAAALRALNRLWGLDLDQEELLAIAAKLGSDVPACLLSAPCWMEGRGECVMGLPAFPALELVLVNPAVPVATARVFAELNARTGVGAMQPPRTPLQSLWDAVAYLADAENDLEAPACRIAPVIDDVLSALDREPACALAQMSGSGATCFGLFDGRIYASGAAERIAQDHPDWWVRLTRIAPPDIGTPHRGGEP